jgi:hypothetical protein
MRRTSVLVTVLLLSAACFTYRAEPAPLPGPSHVRVRFDPSRPVAVAVAGLGDPQGGGHQPAGVGVEVAVEAVAAVEQRRQVQGAFGLGRRLLVGQGGGVGGPVPHGGGGVVDGQPAEAGDQIGLVVGEQRRGAG